MSWPSKPGWGVRIDPQIRRIGSFQSKRSDREPLRAQIFLDGSQGESILVDCVWDSKTLPVVDVYHRVTIAVINPEEFRDQWWIDVKVPAFGGGIIGVSDR